MKTQRIFVALLLILSLTSMGIPVRAFAGEGEPLFDENADQVLVFNETELGDEVVDSDDLDVGEAESENKDNVAVEQDAQSATTQKPEDVAEQSPEMESLAVPKMDQLYLAKEGLWVVYKGVVQPGLPSGVAFNASTNTLTLTDFDAGLFLQYSGAPLTIKVVGKNWVGHIITDENLTLSGTGSLTTNFLNVGAENTSLTINSGTIETARLLLTGKNTTLTLNGGNLHINSKIDKTSTTAAIPYWMGLSGSLSGGAGSTFNLLGGSLTIQDTHRSDRTQSCGITNPLGNVTIKNCVVKIDLKAKNKCIGMEVGSINASEKKINGGNVAFANATLDISSNAPSYTALEFNKWSPTGSLAYYAGDTSLSKTTFEKMVTKSIPFDRATHYKSTTKKVKITVGGPSKPASVFARLAGADRYKTMAAILQKGFAKGSTQTVIVATGENFPDALAASGLAGQYKAPIVLTAKSKLTAEAKAEISRIGAKKAIIIGSSSAVSTNVDKSLKSMGVTPTRVKGATRVETAVEIYKAGKGWSKTAIIASGTAFPDPLSISSFSYAKRAPIFLTDGNRVLTKDVINAIKAGGFTNIIIVGSDAAVSKKVEGQLKGYDITRLGGSDRYATSLLIAEFTKKAGLSANNMAIATGANFPDALAGAALCGKNNAVILLVADSADARAHVKKFLTANKGTIKRGYVLGDKSVVSNSLQAYCNTCVS